MAFGGLDTGSRKEKDVHKVAGMRTYSGLTWMASAWRTQISVSTLKSVQLGRHIFHRKLNENHSLPVNSCQTGAKYDSFILMMSSVSLNMKTQESLRFLN